MRENAKRLACAVAFACVSARGSEALACASDETAAHTSKYAAWCIESTELAAHDFTPYYAYGDAVIEELITLFQVTPSGSGTTLPLTIEARETPTKGFGGGAQTPSDCCGFGETVIADAYYNTSYGVAGFYGYLLTLHELVNQWTGIVSGGWPTDFWADHVSAFPNAMDWQIMAALGTKLGDANLTKASVAQKARFYPGGDSVDPRVPMFDTISALPTMGFAGWGRTFALVQADHMTWDGLGVDNPSQLRTEYVAAYVSLGPGRSVLPTFQAAGVGIGKSDGTQGDAIYTASEANVDAIATAHCAISAAAAQGKDETADRKAFTSGGFAGVAAKGTCGAGCPSECGCKSATGLCVAPWLADATPDGGAIGGGSGDGGGGSGDAGSGDRDGGGSGNGHGGGGNGASGGGDAGNGADPGSSSASTGCSCRAIGDGSGGSRGTGVMAIASLAALAFARSRARRR